MLRSLITLIIIKLIAPKFKNKKSFGEIKNQFMTYDKINKYFKWKPLHSLERWS